MGSGHETEREASADCRECTIQPGDLVLLRLANGDFKTVKADADT